MVICPDVTADATKSFRTRSSRSLGLKPHAVAKRKDVTLKSAEARRARRSSAAIFDLAYAVKGFSADISDFASSPPAPYTEQLDANANAFTPAPFACSPRPPPAPRYPPR